MENATATTAMTYDDALDVFLGTDPSYAGGLSNHGPMAVEALVHLGVARWIGPFVQNYKDRLELVRSPVEAAPANWRPWLAAAITPVVANAATLAGHGLLRAAHAVRALERSGPEPSLRQRLELATAVDYWTKGGSGLEGPAELTGTLEPAAWLETLGRLAPVERSEGLMPTLATAAESPDFASKVAALAPGDDPTHTLDALGAAAAQAFTVNNGLGAFTLLHGTTVSAMASVLIPHLGEMAQRRLEAAVAAFVAAAVIGFDDGDAPGAAKLGEPPAPHELAEAAGASAEDHTIKFVDACLAIARRTGDASLYVAAHRQIVEPYGNTFRAR